MLLDRSEYLLCLLEFKFAEKLLQEEHFESGEEGTRLEGCDQSIAGVFNVWILIKRMEILLKDLHRSRHLFIPHSSNKELNEDLESNFILNYFIFNPVEKGSLILIENETDKLFLVCLIYEIDLVIRNLKA